MYINTQKLNKYPLSPEDYFKLCAIKNGDKEYIEQHLIEQDYSRFEKLSLIKYVKPKNKQQPVSERVRLDERGKDILSDVAEPSVEEEDERVWKWLSDHYKSLGKDIGNGARTKRHIRDFRVQSGIQKNNLIKLCLDFLKENEENSRNLEYVFYYPKTVFAAKFSLEDSWLYRHFLKNQERLVKTFEEY